MEVRPDLAAPLFVITDPTRLWVIADLPERALAKVAVGHSASVEVDAYPDQRFDAIIERVGEVVDPATRRVPLRLRVGNPDRRLKPEMYARVRLLADAARSAVRVPNSALVTSGVYSYVFVETEPGVFARRKVSLAFEDRDWVYVADGLAVGDRVVTAGALLLNSELQEKQ
jgi:cobalt-zinc-cadmium efflux system membrane fusion protein